MKMKKLFAVVLAATLVVLPVSSALAADQTTINGVNNTYQATVNYVDPTQSIRMVVPTNASLAFTLDPQHLAATQGVGTWAPGDGGQILPASVVQIVNKSAVPVKTQVSLSLVDSADDKVVLVEDDTAINTGLAKNMNLTLTPADAETSIAMDGIASIAAPLYFQDGETPADVTFTVAQLDAANVAAGDRIALAAAATATFGQYVATDEPATTYKQVEVPVHDPIDPTVATTVSEFVNATTGFLSTTVVPVTDEGANLAFVMKKADYYVTKTAADGYKLKYKEADTNTNYDVASYIIGGSINMNADWSDYTGTTPATLTLSAAYTFSTMSDTAATTALTGKTSGTYSSVAYVAPVAPSITATTAAVAADTAEVVAVSLGAGDLAATGITSVTYNDGSDHTLVADTDYTFAGTDLTFTTAYINTLIGDGSANVTRTFTVTFNNGTTATTDTIELTYALQAAPSISATTAEVVASTAEVVTVSLGSGGLAATGVASVSYNDGTVHTLVADTDYSFSGTELTFAADYVDSLIGDGIANVARTFTVTFDDTANTTDTIELTFAAPDVAAAVTPANVTFSKATGATVPVTLGSGDGLATGITSVATVVTSDVLWEASYYSFNATTKVLTINASAGISALTVGSTRTIKVTFNTGATDTFIVTIAN